jgi:hypothetical protein
LNCVLLELRVHVLHQTGSASVQLLGVWRLHPLTPGLYLRRMVALLLGVRHALGHGNERVHPFVRARLEVGQRRVIGIRQQVPG